MTERTKPTPQQIKELRRQAGITQAQAAEMMGRSVRTWEGYEGGQRDMPADTWELFLIKARLFKR